MTHRFPHRPLHRWLQGRRCHPPASLPRPRLQVEELEPRILYAADAAALLGLQGGLAAEVREIDLGASADGSTTTPPAPAAAAASLAGRREIIFIDSQVPDALGLADALMQARDGGTQFDMVVLDADEDGVAQISRILAGEQGLSAIHVISHGSDGRLQIGDAALDARRLAVDGAAIQRWGDALTAQGDLLLYGCDLAQGAQGRALVQDLAALTGADVAASTDRTGSAALGGDWALEYRTGTVTAALAPPRFDRLSWQGVLATFTVNSNADTNTVGTLRWAINQANANGTGLDTIDFSGVSNINLSALLPEITGQVSINGANGGGTPGVLINGSGLATGLHLVAGSDGSTVRGLALQNFSSRAMFLVGTSNVTIAGNYIGTDINGNFAAANVIGIDLFDAANTRIGGTTAADRNVISGNSNIGINIVGAGNTGTVVSGNYIGTNAAGNGDLGNTNHGIYVNWASGITIGGTTPGAGNLISGNNFSGLTLGDSATGVAVQGNWIGLNAAGTGTIANNNNGIWILGANNTVGGTDTQARNVISGNGTVGIRLSGASATGNSVLGNYIGTTASGLGATDQFEAVRIETGANNNTIGGALTAQGNLLVTQSDGNGVTIDGETSDDNTVQGNWIGLRADGAGLLGTLGNGVYINDGADAAQVIDNWMGGGTYNGVVVSGASSDTVIQGNRIGTDLAGTANWGFGENSVWLLGGATQTLVGGTLDAQANTLAFSGQGGVYTAGIHLDGTSTGNVFLRNRIHDSVGLGIDLGGDGVNPIDLGDTDSGANGLLNPLGLSLATTNGSTLTVSGTYTGQANTYYRIEVFLNTAPEASGTGEGRTYLGTVNMPVGATGTLTGSYNFAANVAAGSYISALVTRTDASYTTFYETSEFSNHAAAQAINNAPAGSDGTVTATEDTTYTFVVADFGFTDADGDALLGVHFDSVPASGQLRLSGSTLTAGAYVTAADILAGLLTYVPAANAAGNAVASLSFRVQDDGGTANGGIDTDASANTLSINITPLNDAPTVVTSPGSTSYNENAPATAVDAGLTLFDIDSASLTGATVRISAGYVNGQDSLVFVNQLGLTGSWNATTGTLTLNGTASVADYETALRSVSYLNNSDDPSIVIRDVTFSVTDGSVSSNEAVKEVQVVSWADAPNTDDVSASGAEDNAVISITLTGSDPDGTVTQFRLIGLPGQGALYLDAGLTTLASAGVNYAASAQALTLYFVPPADWNGSTWFQYSSVDDTGLIDVSPAVATLTVTAVNDAPTVTLPGPQVTPVNAALTFGTAQGNALLIADVDAGSGLVQLTLTVTQGSFTLSGTTGLSFSTGDGTADANMVFTGTVADIHAALEGAVFTPTGGYHGAAAITLTVNDQGNTGAGGALQASGSVGVQVGALEIRQGQDGYTGAQDARIVSGSPNTNYGGETAIYQNSGEQVLIRFDDLFGNGPGQIPPGANITSASLTLYLDNDGIGTASLHRLVNLTWDQSTATWNLMGNGVQLNDAEALNTADATVSTNGEGYRTFSGLEASLQAWANGATNNGWVITLSGSDWRFMSSENGTLSRRPYLTINYTMPAAPVLNTSGGSASYTENAAPVAVDPGLTISDADSTLMSGATVRITTGHVPAQDQLVFTNQNGITGSWNAATGTLTLSGEATLAQYETALRSVGYANSSDAPDLSPRTIEFSVTDAHSNLSSGAASRNLTVTAVNDAPTGTPVVTGTTAEDQTLTADTSGISDADGLGAFSYQWLRNGVAVVGATSSTYVLGDADVGAQISVRVSYTDGQGTPETLTSAATAAIVNVNDAPLGGPVVTGTPTEDQTLTADTSGLSDADGLGVFNYQWLRDGVAVVGATNATYVLGDADVGAQISLRVTYTDGQGTPESLTSAATAAVSPVNDPPVGGPVVTGTPTEDQTLTADTSGISDADGLGAFNYQWLRNGVAVAGANNSTYTLGDADVGAQMSVRVSYTDGQGSLESLTSAATAAVAPVNDAPAGAPVVTGTPTEDQTLTAHTGGISDADGLGAFSYQWLRDGVAVVGAISATYTLGDADVGAQMSVQVSYTDAQGTPESLTSAATAAVANTNDLPAGTPVITGTPAEDQTLTANTSGISDADGLGGFAYQWLRDGVAVAGATNATYLPGDADVGAQISVQVTYTDGQGSLETLTSAPTAAVANVNDAPVGGPVVSGAPTEDQTLTAGTSSIGDADGLGAFSYQWLRDGVAVVGATNATYSLGDADVGAQISVRVTYTDGQGTLETLTSAATAPIANVNDAPLGAPVVTGTPTENQTLTADTSGLSDADGLGAFSYQWLRDGVAVVGATSATYVLGDADVGAQMSVQVTYTDNQGTPEILTSAATATVANVNDAPAGNPVVTGTPTENQTLTADTSGISDADGLGAFGYQWLRDGVAVVGATNATYLLGDADVGAQMSVRVTYTDGQGAPETLTSAATATVANLNDAPAGGPVVSGTPTEDQTLTADTSGISDADGLGAFSYQWLRDGVAVVGATNATYLLGDADVGAQMSVRVTYTDGQGSPETLTSTATTAVTTVNDPPSGGLVITGTPTEDQTLTADTSGVSDADGLGAFSYQWLRNGVAVAGATNATYVLGDADVGAQISLRVTYTDGQGTPESLTSAATAAVSPVNDTPVGAPVVAGTPTEDQTLTADTSGLSDADGLGVFNYQWLRNGVAVVGATNATYVLGDADVGAQMSVRVAYTDNQGTPETVSSAATAVIANVNDAPNGAPVLTGTPTEDQTLTANTSGIADADGLGAFSYQWLRNGVAVVGATNATYLLGDADVGAQMSVRVTYTDGQGSPETLTSAATAPVANVNDAPAGAPVVTGTPTENQTLTADTSGISDADGLGAFSYQWLRDGLAVAGATNSTYLLGDADVGALMSVRVAYTDGQGTPETLTSTATTAVTNVNDPPSGGLVITGTPTEDQTLTADTSGVSDADGLGAFSYQWLRDGVAVVGANHATYALGDADVGAQMSVRVTYTDGQGTPESLTSAATTVVANANDAPAGGPVVTGTPTENQTLMADTSGISDADGLSAFSYQWLRDGVAVVGATSSTYALGDADVGAQMSVQVTYTDGQGSPETLTSTATTAVATVNDPPSGVPVITGTPTEDQTLTADTTGISDLDGLGAFSFQWLRNGVAVVGATNANYVLGDDDVGAQMSVRVTYIDAQGSQEAVASGISAAVANVNDAPVGAPVVTGTATEGQTLVIDTHPISDADGLGAFSYQWLRDGVAVAGATQASYVLGAADAGAQMSVRTAYIDLWGQLETLHSLATAPVAGSPVTPPDGPPPPDPGPPSAPPPAAPPPAPPPITPPPAEAPSPPAAKPPEPTAPPAPAEPSVGTIPATAGSPDPAGAAPRPALLADSGKAKSSGDARSRPHPEALDMQALIAEAEFAADAPRFEMSDPLALLSSRSDLSARPQGPGAGEQDADDEAGSELLLPSQVATATGVTLAAGTVWWALRAGGLVTSLLVSMPTWRHADLLAVLPDDDEDNEDWDRVDDAQAERDDDAVGRLLAPTLEVDRP